MDKSIGPLQPKYVVVYIDNITILSKDMEQHLKDLESVLKIAKNKILRLT